MNFKKLKIPILMYHAVGEGNVSVSKKEAGVDLYRVALSEFKSQMAYLRQEGFETITLDDLAKPESLQDSLSEKIFILTFDDGDITNFSNVFPLLEQYNFTGHFFIIAGAVKKGEKMDWPQIKELKNNGHIIGSHGMTHQVLKGLEGKDLKYELGESKRILEYELNCSITHLSIPKGHYDQRIIDTAKEIGYRTICTSDIGRNYLSRLNLLRLKRIPVTKDVKIGRAHV